MSARQLRREQARRAIRTAKRAARAQGCTCQLEVTVRPRTLAHVDVAHDAWCALLRSRDTAHGGGFSQLVVVLDAGGAS